MSASPPNKLHYAHMDDATTGLMVEADDVKAGEIWAIALSEDGRYLAGSTYNGRINVWDAATLTSGEKGGAVKIREYETKGSFGMSVALVSTSPFPRFEHDMETNTSSHPMANSLRLGMQMAPSISSTITPAV